MRQRCSLGLEIIACTSFSLVRHRDSVVCRSSVSLDLGPIRLPRIHSKYRSRAFSSNKTHPSISNLTIDIPRRLGETRGDYDELATPPNASSLL